MKVDDVIRHRPLCIYDALMIDVEIAEIPRLIRPLN